MKLCDSLQMRAREMISLVGAGGKSSLMLRLASEEAARGQRVLVTTSTRMYLSQLQGCNCLLLEHEEEILLRKMAACPPGVVAAAGGTTLDNKVTGLSRECLNRIFRSDLFDYILVEADGARQKPLKMPAAHEPVLPSSTTLVLAITGAHSLGLPLTEANVHRASLLAELTGVKPGMPITVEVISKIFEYYSSLTRALSPAITFIPVINQADDDHDLARAEQIATALLLLAPRVLITSALHSDPVRMVIR